MLLYEMTLSGKEMYLLHLKYPSLTPNRLDLTFLLVVCSGAHYYQLLYVRKDSGLKLHFRVNHFTLNTDNSSSGKIKHWSYTVRMTL